MRPRFTLIVTAACLLLGAKAPAQAPPSAAENPFAPTRQQVEARFDAIQREVDRLRSAGQASQADAMAGQLQHFRDELAGTAPSQVARPELNVVGLFGSGRPIVQVGPTDRPVILALNSYYPVNWTVNLAPGANLQRVIVSAYEGASRPAGLPSDVPVGTYDRFKPNSYFFAHQKDFQEYPDLARKLQGLTGQTISSFQVQSNYTGTPFQIGDSGQEWAAQRVLNEMIPLYKQAIAFDREQNRAAAANYRFTAISPRLDRPSYSNAGSIAEFSPLGPIRGTIGGQINSRHVAVDPRTQTFYGVENSGAVFRYDRRTGQETTLNNVEWPTGLTFDTKRNRLVVSSLSGEGALYAYSPDQNRWTTLRSLNNVDMFSTTYSAHDDVYYALAGHPYGPVKLLTYDPSGRQTRSIDLVGVLPYTDLWDYQLTATGDKLSLLSPPLVDLYEPLLPPQAWSYLIDPATGVLTSLGAIRVVPEPGAALLLACLAASALRRRRA